MNQGNGIFTESAEQAGLALTDASGMAAFADYDRDGWLDVLVQTNLFNASTAPRGQPDRLYRNRGGASFEEVTVQSGITGETQGHSATWWDYDEDGWPDLYVANDFSMPDQLWHNRGDGTVENRLETVVPHTPFSAMGADLGDINNDGRMDFLVADMAAPTPVKDQRGMADSRAKVDSAVDFETTPQYIRNALYLNTGTGRMAEVAMLRRLDCDRLDMGAALGRFGQ
ncbi:MAG: VCBS repeat-containing protein [Candidatus Synoicihabitans palmerolidicus]|nr:VCBS repeat-containing protein [Candidatus Synoicihabitans palmerolidicus]